MGKKNDMRAAMIGVIKTRLAWGDGETFPWEGAYGGEAYAHEAEIGESIPEEGSFIVTVPLSISEDEDPDAHVQLELSVNIVEIGGAA